MRPTIVALMMVIGVAACQIDPPEPLPPGYEAGAIAHLDAIQPLSIRQNCEYCGYFGLDAEGRFVATSPRRGRMDDCDLGPFPEGMTALSSYHTHAAFDFNVDSEVPSAVDLEADIADALNGFIATPGGRVWRTDWWDQTTSLVCGIGCVHSDPRFVPGVMGSIADAFSLRELRQRQP